jgi:hypothetical protein
VRPLLELEAVLELPLVPEVEWEDAPELELDDAPEPEEPPLDAPPLEPEVGCPVLPGAPVVAVDPPALLPPEGALEHPAAKVSASTAAAHASRPGVNRCIVEPLPEVSARTITAPTACHKEARPPRANGPLARALLRC